MKNLFGTTSTMKQGRLLTTTKIILAFTILSFIWACNRAENRTVLESDLLAAQMDSLRTHDTLLLRLQREQKKDIQQALSGAETGSMSGNK